MSDPRSHPAPERRPKATTAVLAGLVGLVLAGVLGYLPAEWFIDFGLADLPSRTQLVLGLYLLAAVLLLLGGLVTLFRVFTGGVLLLLGALAAIGAVVGEPLLLFPGQFSQFFTSMFQFVPDQAFVRVAAAVGGPVLLVLCAVPATFRYLRHPERSASRPGW
ncbi:MULTISPECIES: hypothetical protein [Amycolatopsis]|uniref:Uncharacterized protein n=2 Tax=Amycolatopsis TaxID=1813 RepID=A0A1I4DCX0_9PSEU|nr:hypothetical protein [Amycolatopsis sacchari]SFK89956.1 hypothetical protein SAMN05421835_14312 [Amycolatopsis sacchari]